MAHDFDREEMIEAILKNQIEEYFVSDPGCGFPAETTVKRILRTGCVGYENMSDEQLAEEYERWVVDYDKDDESE